MKRKPPKRRPLPRRWAALHEAVIVAYHHLMSLPGVHNLGLGMKEVGGKVTRRACVKIYVAEKPALRKLQQKPFPKSTTILLPSGKTSYKAHRIPTDVVQTQGFRFIGAADYFKDIPSGAQIGAGSAGPPGPGTHCCVVRRQNDGKLFLLTAAHVLVQTSGAVPNTIMVFQPDVTGQKFAVGRTEIGYRGNDPDVGVYLDVAIYAKQNPERTAVNLTWDRRIPKLSGSLSLAQVCATRTPTHKVGAATGYTTGLFSAFYPNFTDPQLGSFLNVLEFVAGPDSPAPNGVLCDGGDSGAAMVSRSPDSLGAIVGVLFAASIDGMRGLVVPFEYIQKRFDIDVA